MRYTAEQVKTAISDWQSSGLSKKAFCLQRGICPQTFYNWLKRIDAVGSSGFTEVTLPSPDQSRGFEIVFPSGARMIVQGEPSPSWLREVLRG
jgi:transposase-like protein